jgi:glucose-1-phosphate cytidylyltransferase
MLTYGDGVSDVDINELIKAHKKSGKLMTMTAVQPSGRFGALNIKSDNTISSFKEKPQGDGAWINGGFFVCEPEVFSYIEPDNPKIIFERQPLENIAQDGNLNAYKHDGFWRPMDTLRDKIELNNLWEEGSAPWKVWDKQNNFVSTEVGVR